MCCAMHAWRHCTCSNTWPSGSPLGYPEGSSPKQKAPTVFIRSRDEENPSGSKPMPTFDPSDLIVRTFLQSASFSLCMAMRILSSMFWFAIFIFRVLKCEAVIFDKYCLAGTHGMSIVISGMPHLYRVAGLPASLMKKVVFLPLRIVLPPQSVVL